MQDLRDPVDHLEPVVPTEQWVNLEHQDEMELPDNVENQAQLDPLA